MTEFVQEYDYDWYKRSRVWLCLISQVDTCISPGASQSHIRPWTIFHIENMAKHFYNEFNFMDTLIIFLESFLSSKISFKILNGTRAITQKVLIPLFLETPCSLVETMLHTKNQLHRLPWAELRSFSIYKKMRLAFEVISQSERGPWAVHAPHLDQYNVKIDACTAHSTPTYLHTQTHTTRMDTFVTNFHSRQWGKKISNKQ